MVLPIVAIALIVRLLRRTLASLDDWQTAVTRVRATNKQARTETKQADTNKHKYRPHVKNQ